MIQFLRLRYRSAMRKEKQNDLTGLCMLLRTRLILLLTKQKAAPGWGLREGLFVPVVGAALDDLDHAAINAVDDPVCIVDAAAPIAGQIAAEALGLTDALIAVAVDVLQKL